MTWSASAGPAIAVLFLGNCFYWAMQPFQPRFPLDTLDGSWVAVLGEAAERGLQWGAQVVCTFGPGSALYTNYYTPLYPALNLLTGLIISLILGGCATLVIWRRDRTWLVGLLATLALGAAITLTTLVTLSRDALLLASALVVFFAGVRSIERGSGGTLAAAAGAAALGILALSKTTFVVGALVLLVVADAYRMVNRRIPVLAPVLLVSAAATYLALGQSLAGLPLFFTLQAEMVRGYSEAMWLPGSIAELLSFLALSALIAALVLFLERSALARPGLRLNATLLLLSLSAFWLLAFKGGFVRQDVHTAMAWQSVGIGAILYAFASAPSDMGLRRTVLLTILAAGVAMVAVIAPLQRATEPAYGGKARLGEIYAEIFLRGPARHWSSIAALVADPAGWRAHVQDEKQRAWASIQRAHPLPKLEGSVDIIPSQQTAGLANGLNYTPRPVFQEYFSYTPRLVDANRAYFQGPHAPDWLIFAPGSIDERYPSSADGALWPDFLAAYEPVRVASNLLYLRRRAQALGNVLGQARPIEAHIGEAIALRSDEPIFVKLEMRKTLLGHLLNFFYRPPGITIVVTTRGGAELSHRLIPEMARSGFLLSPYIANVGGYLAVALGETDASDNEKIESFRIVLSPWGRWAYADKIAGELIAINTEALRRAGSGNPLKSEIAAQANLTRIVRTAGLKPSPTFGPSSEGIFAHAPNRLPLDIPAGARRLTIGFGIRDGAWQAGQTDGVCFRIDTAAQPAGASALFERCLRPLTQASDRGNQTATIDLAAPPGSRLWLETTCLENCSWDWSYWSRIELQ